MEYGPESIVTVDAPYGALYTDDIEFGDDDGGDASDNVAAYDMMSAAGIAPPQVPRRRPRRGAAGGRRKQPQQRSTRYFLPRVTPNEWHETCSLDDDAAADDAGGIKRTPSDKKRLERLESVVLADKDPHFTLIQKPNQAFPQYVGMGYVRATIGAAPFGQLQDVVAYLLKHHLVSRPENYDYYDMLKPTGGGREILLNELFKESDDTLMKVFLLLKRVRPAVEEVRYSSTARKRRGNAGEDDPDAVEGEHENVSASGASLDGATITHTDLPFTMQQYPSESKLTTTWYTDIPTDPTGLLQANIGGPYNDKRVYIEHPVRSIKGHYDSVPDQMVDLCGPELNNWMRRTAHETKRDRATFVEFEDYREKVAERKRAVCPVTPNDVKYALELAQQGKPLDEPLPWSKAELDALRRIGWSEAELNQFGYSGSPPVTAAATATKSS